MYFNYYIVTLCKTDLECQELKFSSYNEAEDTADRLSSFLPKRLVHSIILEGVRETAVSFDEDGFPQFETEIVELKIF